MTAVPDPGFKAPRALQSRDSTLITSLSCSTLANGALSCHASLVDNVAEVEMIVRDKAGNTTFRTMSRNSPAMRPHPQMAGRKETASRSGIPTIRPVVGPHLSDSVDDQSDVNVTAQNWCVPLLTPSRIVEDQSGIALEATHRRTAWLPVGFSIEQAALFKVIQASGHLPMVRCVLLTCSRTRQFGV
jgi:hypothetical protein